MAGHFEKLLNQVFFHLSLKNLAHLSNHLLCEGPDKDRKNKFDDLELLDSPRFFGRKDSSHSSTTSDHQKG